MDFFKAEQKEGLIWTFFSQIMNAIFTRDNIYSI